MNKIKGVIKIISGLFIVVFCIIGFVVFAPDAFPKTMMNVAEASVWVVGLIIIVLLCYWLIDTGFYDLE